MQAAAAEHLQCPILSMLQPAMHVGEGHDAVTHAEDPVSLAAAVIARVLPKSTRSNLCLLLPLVGNIQLVCAGCYEHLRVLQGTSTAAADRTGCISSTALCISLIVVSLHCMAATAWLTSDVASNNFFFPAPQSQL